MSIPREPQKERWGLVRVAKERIANIASRAVSGGQRIVLGGILWLYAIDASISQLRRLRIDAGFAVMFLFTLFAYVWLIWTKERATQAPKQSL